jgi:hypothetical protein
MKQGECRGLMRFLLDTSIISNITKPIPSESLIARMARADQSGTFHRFADHCGNSPWCAGKTCRQAA